MILSDSLALVQSSLSAQDGQKIYCFAFIFASGFRAGFVRSFRWIPSELNYSDKGSCFFDRDYESSKSLLHALAQRLARSSPSRTNPRLFSPSRLHLDAGDVNHSSHTPTCPQSAPDHKNSQINSRAAQDMQRLSHLKVLPLRSKVLPLGRTMHRFFVLWFLCSDGLIMGLFLVWLNRNFWTSHVSRARTTLTSSRVVCVWAHCSFLKLRAYRGLPPARSRSAWRKVEDSSTNPTIVPFPCDLPPQQSGSLASSL